MVTHRVSSGREVGMITTTLCKVLRAWDLDFSARTKGFKLCLLFEQREIDL